MTETPPPEPTNTVDEPAVIDASIRLIAITEVAELLSCSSRHVQRLTDTGRMPAPIKLGHHLTRWNLAELQHWIQQGCPEQPPATELPLTNPGFLTNSDKVSP